MGQIINITPLTKEKSRYTIVLEKEEFLLLEGNYNGVHFFSYDNFSIKAGIIGTGTKYSTKYFIIPPELALKKELRRKEAISKKNISCQLYTLKDKEIYIYIFPKQPPFLDK